MNISDLSPAALKELEAKLESQLVLVRKVLALLEEHALETAGGAAVKPQVVATVPVAPVSPPYVPPPKLDPRAETLAVLEKVDGVFAMKQLTNLMAAENKYFRDQELRAVMNSLVKQGVLAVAKHRNGRGGCLYRKL